MPDLVAAPLPRKANLPVLSSGANSVISPALLPVDSLVLAPFSPMSKMDSNLPALLDELLDDCFQYSIDPKCLCETRARYVQNFHRFLTERHTHENLAFVIEIFRYEYFFDKIYPENVTVQKARSASNTPSHYSSSFLNQSLEHFIDSLPYPTSSMQRKIHKVGTSDSDLSISGFLLSDQLGFDFDDIPPSSSNAWDALKDQNVSSDEEESMSRSSLTLSPLDSEGLLTDQWNHVVREFILENSPQQVNLSSKTVVEIMAEDSIQGLAHNPIVLIKAKLEVIQLLEENAYRLFLRSQKAEFNMCECKGSCQANSADSTMVFTSPLTSGSPSSKKHLQSPQMKASSPLARPFDLRDHHAGTSTKSMASPLPQSRIKSKFLSHLSNNSETSSSGSSISSFMHHFRTHSGGTPRAAVSVPHSGANSQAQSPVQEIPRASSTVHEGSPSLLGKILRKKK